MMRTALLLSLLTATTAKKGGNNKAALNRGNGNVKKLGGFETFEEASSSGTTITSNIGQQCTITTTSSKVCSSGIAQSFTLTDIYGTSLTYDCSCPTSCSESDSGNTGTGAYTCTLTDTTTNNYIDGLCGDIDLTSLIFTDSGCSMDAADGTIRCEENCYCDASMHLCTVEGEECCAGTCQKVSGKGVKGKWELQCLGEEEAEEEKEGRAKGKVEGGEDVYEEAE